MSRHVQDEGRSEWSGSGSKPGTARGKRRPKPALAVTPVVVTQHTSFAVLGLEGRRFRELVARIGIRHCRDGQLVLVQVEDFIAAIDARASSIAPDFCDTSGARDYETADEILAAVGHRPVRS